MKRRYLMFAGICSFASSCSNPMIPSEEDRTPNIIYILADDLGYGDLGCYGQSKIETPHIDALAARGIRFTQHYTSAPVCAPARCMLLTGVHSGHAQIRGNDEWPERGNVRSFEAMANDPYLEGQRPITPGTQTIGTLLQDAGYATGLVGKWGLGGPATEGVPNNLGFDYFYGYNCQRQAHTYFPLHLWENKRKVMLNNKLVPPGTKLPKEADPYAMESYQDFWLDEYSPELMQHAALNFIKKNKENPFFLYYATPIPHVPLQAPQKWVNYYVKKFGNEEPYLGEQGYFPHRYPKACYAAMVSYLDEQVGELVSTLKALGIYENTLIIFSSDNGPTYNGGTNSPWFESANPFQSEKGWAKGYLNEGGIRIPMIAQWPGKISPGITTDLISAHYDLLQTICDLKNIEPEVPGDGISFLPALLGQKQKRQHDHLYWEFPASGGQQAVRIGKWKGIRKDMLKGNMEIQLYNLEEDIRESVDLASQFPAIVKKIEKIFEKEHVPAEIERFRIKGID